MDYSIELNNQDELENCMNITHLDLSLEDLIQISNKTFADCRNLESLIIESNSLINLPDGLFNNQRNLQILELVGENIKLRANPFEGLQSLSRLILRSMDLNLIEGNFFHKLYIKRLEYDLQYRQRPFTFPIGFLKSHETLEELVILWADLSQFPDDFVPILRTLKLKTLELKGNRISSAEPFVDLPNVEEINLWGNHIKELPANSFRGCPKLTHLDLGYNPISSFRGDEFNLLSGLKELDLYYTKLTRIAPNTFCPLKSLEVLYMQSSFKGDEFVIENELFMHSVNLRRLYLENNNITAIHRESFDNLKQLTSLYLQNNKCVDRDFYAAQNETLAMVKKELQTCFDSYPKMEVKSFVVWWLSILSTRASSKTSKSNKMKQSASLQTIKQENRTPT